MQVHHLLARSQGGKDSYGNLVLVHLLCHQHIHAKIKRAMRDCQQVNNQELLAKGANTRQSKQKENKEPCCS